MHPLIIAAAEDPTTTGGNPALRLALMAAGIGGAIAVITNLRNFRLWLLLLTGRAAEGTVASVELRGTDGGFLKRPHVTFALPDGRLVTATPTVLRKKCPSEGGTVALRYAADDPERIVVRGHDFRMREVVSIGAGVVLMVGGTWLAIAGW